MEKLDLRKRSAQAKSIGTIVSITGAFIVTLYKGPPILLLSSSSSLQSNWIIGGFILAMASFFLALGYIVQTWVIKAYPSEMMMMVFSCFFVTIISGIVALTAERDPKAWALKPDMELVTVLYSAILVVALRGVVHAWALDIKGPVFVSMFKPVGVVIAVILGVSFLGDTLHIGSVIGAVILAIGFYTVMWGKAKEEKNVEDGTAKCSFDSSSPVPDGKIPLLKNKNVHTDIFI